MKRTMLSLMLLSLAFIMPYCGFASDSDLAPTEKVTVGDLDHDFYVVISSDIVNDSSTDFGCDNLIKKVDPFAGDNSNQYGLPSMTVIMDRATNDYPYVNEWKTNKLNLGFKLNYTKNENDAATRIRYLSK